MSARHLYVHVPFCTRRCSYCDFAIAVRPVVPVDDYLRGLALELERSAKKAGGTLELDTIYLGGGTPSRLGVAGVSRVLDLVRSRYSIAIGAEITIEANPEDLTQDAVSAWMNSGVNRLSIGIQSFDDRVLRWMHRVHDSARGLAAVTAARAAGMDNLSIDLIFALPGNLRRSWESDLDTALSLEPDHISLYGLTVEPSTPVARWNARGEISVADEDIYAEEFLLACRKATAFGYRHYEVSNFARPGRESRHNSAYWTGVGYLGVGPSAHSFDGRTRAWNVPAYAEWLRKLDAGESPRRDEELLSERDQASERVYLGLRTAGGLRARGADLEKARAWTGPGWARIDDDLVRLTPEGWLRLDSLAAGLTGF